ncbi:MAG TPA: alpha/beta hydrolase [Terriglobales bacterium]|nr:alpha/beta hydrolase [Terriglobales bacterium]
MSNEDILSRKPPEPDLTMAYGRDENQFVHIRLPQGKGPHPVVFFVHGGYWRAKYDLVHAGHLCAALKQAGIATWNIEYRRVGNPGGGWPGTFEDLRSALRMLTMNQANDTLQQLDLKRLCVAGHSAGGQLALALAAYEPNVTRVLSLAGVLDLRRGYELHLSNDAVAGFLGGPPNQVPEHYREASPCELKVRAEQVLVHGDADDSVPYEFSRSYAEQKKRAGERVELITLPKIGHFEIIDPSSGVWNKVQGLFAALVHN